MKKLGIVIIVIGLLIIAFAGFRFVTKEKVVDLGSVQITRDKSHLLDWSPAVGGGIIAIGAGVYLLGAKKQ
jgi:uncharacterized membrane protein YidH (DUF202 family)